MYNSYTKYNLNICVIVIIFNFTVHIHMLYISIHMTAGFIKCLNFDVKGSTLVVHVYIINNWQFGINDRCTRVLLFFVFLEDTRVLL